MTRCMNVDEAKGLCKDRSIVLWFPPTLMGKSRDVCMYVCILYHFPMHPIQKTGCFSATTRALPTDPTQTREVPAA